MHERFILNENGNRFVIIKVGSKDTLENMKKGIWWFQHPAFFQKDYHNINDIGRADGEDSIIEHQKSFTIPVREHIYTSSGTIHPCNITIMYKKAMNDDSARIICFYKLKLLENDMFQTISNKMNSFGDYFAFVDIKRAIDLIKSEMKNVLWGYINEFDMEYHSEEYNGEVGIKGKRNEYEYQNERRIRIDSIENIKMITQDKEIQKIENDMKNALIEQENYAEQFRKAEKSQRQYFSQKTFDANKKYNELYQKYLEQKSTENKVKKFFSVKDCLSNIYEFKDLLNGNKKLSDFN